jgi:hypothetical protein
MDTVARAGTANRRHGAAASNRESAPASPSARIGRTDMTASIGGKNARGILVPS